MTLTFWAAIAIVIATIYALVRRYETRLVLCISGLVMCAIAMDPMAAFDQFAKSMTSGGIDRVNILFAIAPLVPLTILLLGNTCVPSIKMGVAQAMLIGAVYTMIVTRCDPQKAFTSFFDGAGKGYANILGIIIAAGVFAAGLRETGIISALIEALKSANEFARVGGALGTFAMAVLSGSGDAATFAFNEAVTPHAAQLGRTMSPIAGVVILLAGMARVSPIDLVKRTAIPMIVTWLVLILAF